MSALLVATQAATVVQFEPHGEQAQADGGHAETVQHGRNGIEECAHGRQFTTAVLALLVLASTGCAHGFNGAFRKDYCVTRCGMSALDSAICPGLQEQEDVTLALFDQRGVAKRDDACRALRNFQVGINIAADSSGVFPDPYGRMENGHVMRVAGITTCELHYITVGNAKWHDLSNSLSHEMLHAIQHCKDGPNGEQHYRWDELHYFQAIRDCHALPPGFVP